MSSVSVIIPNFNRASLVGDTISNVLRQSLKPSEVIVVDDGSTDQSVEVIRSFGDKVKLVQQRNQGPGAARNAGLRIATGKFIQFQDSDDLFSLNKLEAQSELLEQTGADIAFSPWVKLTIKERTVSLENHVLQQKMPPPKLELAHWWLRSWSTVFQSLLFRRSFLADLGFYRTDLILCEDSELFFRALLRFPRVAFTNEALTLYRLHNLNKLTQDEGTSRANRVIDWARCLRCMWTQADSCGLKVDFATHSIFLSAARKHLHHLREAPDAPNELVDALSRRVARMPDIWLGAVEGWRRVSEQIRLRVRGSRWIPAYQAGALTEKQRGLIWTLGFEVE